MSVFLCLEDGFLDSVGVCNNLLRKKVNKMDACMNRESSTLKPGDSSDFGSQGVANVQKYGKYAYGSQDEQDIINSFVNNVPPRGSKSKKRKLSGDEVILLFHPLLCLFNAQRCHFLHRCIY